jgi:predicted alpha/beta superfamily hydrolase
MSTAPATPTTTEMALDALRIDFRSSINGRDYRLFISVPAAPAPPQGHPVLYLIDGNLHFGIAVDTARIQGCWPDVSDPVIVGIGYPTHSISEALRVRNRDLTMPPRAEWITGGWRGVMGLGPEQFGGMDDYLRVIDEEVKPRVAAVVPIDAKDQTLMGHSLGGLTTLHALFRRPGSFQQYVAISPSIWMNESSLLDCVPAFVRRARDGEVQARLLISVGALEGDVRAMSPGVAPPAPEQVFREMAEECRMVLNVQELGAQLDGLPGLEVQIVVHAGDDHNMVPPAGIARGIRFAFRRAADGRAA